LGGRGRQHRLGGGQHDVALADCSGDADGGVGSQRHLLLAPFPGGWVAAQREQLALDIVERLHPQDIFGGRDALDRLRLGRGHRGDDRHLAVGRHVGERQRDERACGDACPILVEKDHQLTVDDVADAGGVGDDRRNIARGIDVRQLDVGGVKGFAAADHRPTLVAVSQGKDVHADVFGFAFGHRFGRR